MQALHHTAGISTTPAAAWQQLLGSAAAPYRAAGRFAHGFARGKLGRDPVFRHLIECGAFTGRQAVLDIGCGQGLLACLLAVAQQHAQISPWPTGWPAAPAVQRYCGIELMQADVDRALAATQSLPSLHLALHCADMRTAPFPASDCAVILDVLHYVNHAEQHAVLARVLAALLQAGGGTLWLRVGDADSARGFAASQWVDRIVTLVRGHRVPPTFGRPLAGWVQALHELGFAVASTRPMSSGTPFANVLIEAVASGTPTATPAPTPTP